jgi:hypothetical protein
MITKIMEWVSITALLQVVSWRPIASYQIPLDLVVCWGALVGVLALFSIKREMETHDDVDNRCNPASRVTVNVWLSKLASQKSAEIRSHEDALQTILLAPA